MTYPFFPRTVVLRRKVPVETTAGITKACPDKPYGNRSAGRSYSGADSCFVLLPAYRDPSGPTGQMSPLSEGCGTDPAPKAVLPFLIHPDPDYCSFCSGSCIPRIVSGSFSISRRISDHVSYNNLSCVFRVALAGIGGNSGTVSGIHS